MDKEKTAKYVDPNNARPGHAYEGVIKAIAEEKVCPFCPEQLANFHKQPVEIDGIYWLATKNQYPYTCVRHHLLLIHKAHIEHVEELSPEAWVELKEIITKLNRGREIAGGTFMLRFGETTYTGASVTHLHAHIIQSDPDHERYREPKSMPGVIARVG
ncbi:MAG: hypothetical protein COV10_04715 [Candidatus Vogelbacteria bacterium CG10_big_fil_rev_8_21_14_0_10_51_16]|uniref:HIT domain-containing protein n=1 Tax=Candidatus Vogelbacteria bacterium CG10_big_fil_rev_8_21_14_0_10_51_16 TaxID=1975045 RepID=A0A2H0RCY7_9BACT|nr:MAG: hypothetical protein COV10_04715 [Candidatus Vogelbacteria bacterium CG10_big_fil_rev_8_21_14_0_10_51_16]